jgi:fructokinase
MKTLSFGEILFDRIEGKDHFGGAPVNVAVHLARLGANSYMLSALGKDAPGKEAQRILEKENVLPDFIQFDSPHPTGLVEVEVKDGIPSYDIKEGAAWDTIELTESQIEKLTLERWDLIYCGSLAQRTEANRKFLADLLPKLSFRHLFFDVNLRQEYFSEQVIRDTMAYTTLLKLNDEELPIIGKLLFGKELSGEDFFREASKNYALEMLLLTCGAKGAELYHKETGRKALEVPSEKVKVEDTVGAGDSFSGAFLYFFLKGDSLEQAGWKAARMADYVVGRSGALPPLDDTIRGKLGI